MPKAKAPRKKAKKTVQSPWKARLLGYWRQLELWRQKYPYRYWTGALLVLPATLLGVFVLSLIFLVWAGAFGELPTRDRLGAMETPEASWLLDHKGQIMSRYYEVNRELVAAEDVPDVLLQALLSTEDARFFEHRGIDWQATTRAIVFSGLLGKEAYGGGSTLSQQLAKNLFPRHIEGKFDLLIAKIKEAIVASRIEREYGKEELLTMYLNTVPFGENIYGIKLASLRFFNVEPDKLSITQAATLIGMLKANSSYHPVWHPEASLKRRNLVLSRMAGEGHLGQMNLDSLQARPLDLEENKSRTESNRTYFTDRFRDEIEALLNGRRNAQGKPFNLERDGLRIYSSLDARMQQKAEKALRTHLADLQKSFREHWKGKTWDNEEELLNATIKESRRYQSLLASGMTAEEAKAGFGESREIEFSAASALGKQKLKSSWKDSVRQELLRLRAGFVVADPETGAVRAYVGGDDYRSTPFNSALAQRQVGSTFKPLVYALALEDGFQPCDFFQNEQRSYAQFANWSPRNADGKYGGEYSMTGALVNSVNTVTVELAMEVGVRRIQQLSQKLGLEGVPKEPSAALGTASLTLEDMLSVYGMFARGGRRMPLYFIEKIETRDGELIYQAEIESSGDQILEPGAATQIDYMLRQVANRGTGAALSSRFGVQTEVAGKTGTTQEQADGWFAGYSPDLVFVAWVGGQYPSIRWRSLSMGQGSRTALPIVGKFLDSYEGSKPKSFEPIPEDLYWTFDCEDYRDHSWDWDWYEGEGDPDEPGAAERRYRSEDDPDRIQEREAYNEKVRREREEQSGEESGGAKRFFERLFKRNPQ